MVDIEKIKERLKNLKRENTGNSNQQDWLWKPADGEYKVRLLPFPDDPTEPVKCLFFYYGIKKFGLLAPYQFDKPDPIKEFQQKLYKDGSEESKNLAKKLYAKPQGFVPVVVRGEEEKGVRLWRFSATVFQRILEMFVDEEIGLVNDPNNGRDLKVKMWKPSGKLYRQTDVDPSLRESPLSSDEDKMKEWLDSIPTLKDKFDLLSYDELKNIMESWLAGDEEPDTSNEGTSREGGDSSDDKSSSSLSSSASFDELDDVFSDADLDGAGAEA